MSKRAQTATVETTQNREPAVAERHAVAAATHADPTPPGLAQTLLALLESLGPPTAAATRAACRAATIASRTGSSPESLRRHGAPGARRLRTTRADSCRRGIPLCCGGLPGSTTDA